MSASINATAKCWAVWAYFTTFDPLAKVNQSKTNSNNQKKKCSDKEEADGDESNSMSVDVDDDGYYDESELELVGFISVVKHYGKNMIKMSRGNTRFHFREHRTVI